MMPQLQSLSLAKRIALAILIVVVAILLLIALSRLFGTDAEAQAVRLQPSPFDERLVALDRLALEDAYRDRIQLLFGIWMKDPTGQPERAINGANLARQAYVAVMHQIQARDKDVQDRKSRN